MPFSDIYVGVAAPASLIFIAESFEQLANAVCAI